jgi:asparagine synthase (glutamine-hydrolysing)
MQGGQGSDEILCGYDDFFSVYASELFWAFRFKKLINFLKKRAKLKCTDLQKEAISIISNVYFPRALRFIKMLLGRKCFLWMSAEWRGLANKQHRYPDQKTINGLSLQQMKYTSLAYQLHSEDRNSMAHSVESRLPFLDHRLVEYCMGLPAEYKIKNGYNKYVFREAVEELPDSIRWRKHKMGFPSPDEEWILRNQSLVGAELEKCLENSNIFSVELLNRFKRFVEGDLPFESIYFRAIALNKFIEIFKVKLE